MATVRPFRGMRYDTNRVGTDLSSVICPPADSIPPARRRILHDRHPFNFCRLVAPSTPPEAPPKTMGGSWLSSGILVRDAAPAFYLTKTIFTATVGGVDDRFSRIGLIVDLEHDPITDAGIQTPFSEAPTSLGSLSDSEGTRLLLEPAMLGYADPHQTLGPLLLETLAQTPLARALDDESVDHSIHAVTDPAVMEAIQVFFRNRPLMALDGSSWSNSSRRLAILVEFSDPGLFATPVHRVYRGNRNIDPHAFEKALSKDFRLEHLPWAGGDAASALLASAPANHHAFLLRWKGAEDVLLIQAPHGSFPQVSGAATGSIPIDATILDQVVEDRMQSITSDVSVLRVRDAHNAMNVLDHLEDGRLAILSNPCSIADLDRVASMGGQIPSDTMAFLPRPCCGLVSLPLHG